MTTETKRVGQLYREALIKTIKDGFDHNDSVFLFNYDKLSANQVGDLRKTLTQAGAEMHVSKNRIAKIALKELSHEPLAQNLQGQTAFVWSESDSVEISKILVKFAKEFEQVVVQGGVLQGDVLDSSDIYRLSDLPSREVLLCQLLGTIQAPVTQLLGALNAKSRDLLSILKQYSEQKGGN